MIELLKAYQVALVIGLYLIGGIGGVLVVGSFAYCVEPPLKTPKEYNRARRVANVGVILMAVIAPITVGVLCYILQ